MTVALILGEALIHAGLVQAMTAADGRQAWRLTVKGPNVADR